MVEPIGVIGGAGRYELLSDADAVAQVAAGRSTSKRQP
jgi:hypothetical protein